MHSALPVSMGRFRENIPEIAHRCINHKKAYRVYKKIHFNKHGKLKKCLPMRIKSIWRLLLSRTRPNPRSLCTTQDGKLTYVPCAEPTAR